MIDYTGWKITPEVISQRTDLRHIPVCSIDPPGCKDIDDALHCVRLPNGRIEAGVHIADVTYFVHPDTAIDKEAAHRSTSTYLGNGDKYSIEAIIVASYSVEAITSYSIQCIHLIIACLLFTLCLVDRRLDMLPGLLTTQLCSLRSSEVSYSIKTHAHYPSLIYPSIIHLHSIYPYLHICLSILQSFHSFIRSI